MNGVSQKDLTTCFYKNKSPNIVLGLLTFFFKKDHMQYEVRRRAEINTTET